MVSEKLMPFTNGITNENCDADNALNNASADRKTRKNEKITSTCNRKETQSLNWLRTLPLSFHLIIPAPVTLNKAYSTQKKRSFTIWL